MKEEIIRQYYAVRMGFVPLYLNWKGLIVNSYFIRAVIKRSISARISFFQVCLMGAIEKRPAESLPRQAAIFSIIMEKKIMKRLTFVFVLALYFTSCISTTSPLVYTDNPGKDFIVLGEVSYSSNVNGYMALLAAAKKKYPNCDYVIDIMIDRQTTLILFIFSRDNYVMRGTAIRYTRNTSEEQSSMNEVIPSSGTEIKYTVKGVTGSVQQEIEGKYIKVNIGDVLASNTMMRFFTDGSLILSDGKPTITIPRASNGILAEIIKKYGH